MNIEGLDLDAWERWKAYRKAIRKEIKPVSEHAMALKLSRYGDDQAAVVSQSISNQWQGLFDLKKSPKAPGERPVKTEKQIAADNELFAQQRAYAERGWSNQEPTPFNRLKLCEALWARYTIDPDEYTPEKLEWLRGVIAMHLREADPAQVLGEPGLRTMVWCFFKSAGIERLKQRAAA